MVSSVGHPIVRFSLSPDQRSLATLASDGSLAVFRLHPDRLEELTRAAATGAPTRDAHGKLAFSPDSEWLAVSTPPGGWKLLELRHTSAVTRIGGDEDVTDFHFTPGSRWLALRTGRGARVWSVIEQRALCDLDPYVDGSVETERGPLFWSGLDERSTRFSVFDGTTGRLLTELAKPRWIPNPAVALGRDGTLVAVAGTRDREAEGSCEIRALEGNRVLQEIAAEDAGPLMAMSFDPGGEFLAVAWARTMRIVAVQRGEVLYLFSLDALEGGEETTFDALQFTSGGVRAELLDGPSTRAGALAFHIK